MIAQASSRRLTTPEAVRATGALTDADAVLLPLIDRASAAIETHCGRRFAREVVRETFRPTHPVRQLALARWPVKAVVSVAEDDRIAAPADYECDPTTGIIRRLCGGRLATWMPVRIEVEYEAGYVLPGEPESDLPADLEDACIRLVRVNKASSGRDPALRSAQAGTVHVTFDTGGSTAIPLDISGLLAPFRVPLVA